MDFEQNVFNIKLLFYGVNTVEDISTLDHSITTIYIGFMKNEIA